MEAHRGRTLAPLDEHVPGCGCSLRRLRRPANEQQPRHLDHLGSHSIDQPTWTIHASPDAPAPIIADLAEEIAHSTGTERSAPASIGSLRVSPLRHRPSRRPSPDPSQAEVANQRTRAAEWACGLHAAGPLTPHCPPASSPPFAASAPSG
ncbi:DUF317 domain-containing protein [Streptomyces sp. CA-179760]|uniref:DUF317 domain-containing protein n=1 Tax=Streptomyces sp. CA-179760 TaxID=3240054 RepID=UPI003D941D4C